jgi:hypothetical protein
MVQVGHPLQLSPQIPMARVAGRELELIGSHGMAAADFPMILEMVRVGKLEPESLVERECTYPVRRGRGDTSNGRRVAVGDDDGHQFRGVTTIVYAV